MVRYRKFRNFRRRYKSKAKGMLGMSLPYVAGVLVGITNMDDKLPKNVVLGAAIAPTTLMRGGLGKFKAFSQGVVAGNMMQGMGIGLPGGIGGGGSSRSW